MKTPKSWKFTPSKCISWTKCSRIHSTYVALCMFCAEITTLTWQNELLRTRRINYVIRLVNTCVSRKTRSLTWSWIWIRLVNSRRLEEAVVAAAAAVLCVAVLPQWCQWLDHAPMRKKKKKMSIWAEWCVTMTIMVMNMVVVAVVALAITNLSVKTSNKSRIREPPI